jgi:hypothetical protein
MGNMPSNPNDSTSAGDGAPLSPMFLEFCAKVRNNDPSILPEPDKPFEICPLSEKEDMALADALMQNSNVTYLELDRVKHTKRFAKAMAEYMRTSKCLQRIRLVGKPEAGFLAANDRQLKHHEEMMCCFLPAFQGSTSLKEVYMDLPFQGGPSIMALKNMLTHTQSLQSLSLSCGSVQRLEAIAVAAASSGLKKNTTLQELTLLFPRGSRANLSPILTSLCDHPLLRSLRLRVSLVDLTGLETLLLSNNCKITELEIRGFFGGPPMTGFTRVWEALKHRPTLTKLQLRLCNLGRGEARQLGTVLRNTPFLQSLDLTGDDLGSAGLEELAPALYHNTSIKELNLSSNRLDNMESAELLRGILRSNKAITVLNLSWNCFRETIGAVECIADGLGSNSTLLKIDLTRCSLEDGGVSALAQTLGSRNTTLQKLALGDTIITSTGVRMLLYKSHQITDLNLELNPIENRGATLLAVALGKNALPNLTRLSLSYCEIDDAGFIALVSSLKQNTSLLQLGLSGNRGVSERSFLALAESLPKIKVLQGIELNWCTGLASAMPLLLAGLRKNTSVFRFHVTGCAPSSVPPTSAETARYAGGWMQEMERLGYRNRCLSVIRAPKERLPPRGVLSHALAKIATFHDAIFEVLRSEPSLVLSFLGAPVPKLNCCHLKIRKAKKQPKIWSSRRKSSK